MTVNKDYKLRKVAGEYILVPVGKAALRVKGLIRLSESGCFLFEKMQSGCEKSELLEALQENYEIDGQNAAEDLEQFLNQMRQLDILMEE